MSQIDYLTKEPSWISRFLWWCAGADEHFLKLSPMQDRVKYAGIGGIVLCTGLLAAFSGGFAFYTIKVGETTTSNEWIIERIK